MNMSVNIAGVELEKSGDCGFRYIRVRRRIFTVCGSK